MIVFQVYPPWRAIPVPPEALKFHEKSFYTVRPGTGWAFRLYSGGELDAKGIKRAAWPQLVNLNQQTFQIFALGKIQGYRVIGSALEPTDDTGGASRVERGSGDDFLE